jgi:hypothetical protein
MSLNDYLNKRRRNQAKKQLRRTKPYLFGDQLDQEVDRQFGISDSGSMDWAAIQKTEVSDYPTPDSVRYEDVVEIAKEFKLRPYALYWFYLKKVNKLDATGRKKNDYKALLKELAPSVIGKELDFDTKIVAATIYAKDLKSVTLTRSEAESMIMEGKI